MTSNYFRSSKAQGGARRKALGFRPLAQVRAGLLCDAGSGRNGHRVKRRNGATSTRPNQKAARTTRAPKRNPPRPGSWRVFGFFDRRTCLSGPGGRGVRHYSATPAVASSAGGGVSSLTLNLRLLSFSRRVMLTLSPSLMSPRSRCSAKGSSRKRSTARRIGRAP